MFLWLNLGMPEYVEIKMFLKFPQSCYAKSKKGFGPNLFFVNNGVMENYVFWPNLGLPEYAEIKIFLKFF